MNATSNGSDAELDEILEAVRVGGWFDANPNERTHEVNWMDTDIAKAAILAWRDTTVAKAQLKVIDDIYAMSPTYQFKDWRPETAVKFYEQLKAYEAELKKQGKEKT